jgi:hypothetical protein
MLALDEEFCALLGVAATLGSDMTLTLLKQPIKLPGSSTSNGMFDLTS